MFPLTFHIIQLWAITCNGDFRRISLFTSIKCVYRRFSPPQPNFSLFFVASALVEPPSLPYIVGNLHESRWKSRVKLGIARADMVFRWYAAGRGCNMCFYIRDVPWNMFRQVLDPSRCSSRFSLPPLVWRLSLPAVLWRAMASMGRGDIIDVMLSRDTVKPRHS